MRAIVAIASCAAMVSSVVAQPCDPAAPQVSLYDLGAGTYKTFQGGLYPGGSNQRPLAHDTAGRQIAAAIQPIDTNGIQSPSGRIVLISIGISNMTQEWRVGANNDPASASLAFTAKVAPLQASGVINSMLLVVDGAKGPFGADLWGTEPPDMASDPWLTALNRLQFSQSSRLQVQVACVKAAHPGPTTCIANDGSTLGDAGALSQDFAGIARNLKIVFPNIKLAYYVSRSYGGYAASGNREPFAFEQGFGVKWAIESQITGSAAFGNLEFQGGGAVAPWMGWGAYLWANGNTPSGLGMTWDIADFVPDHIHPSASGVDKASTAFLNFFLTDETTRPWFGWQCLHGDVNGDGNINAMDIAPFTATLLAPQSATVVTQCRADVDNDGLLMDADMPAFVALLLSS